LENVEKCGDPGMLPVSLLLDRFSVVSESNDAQPVRLAGG
jgi:hypothetical protein